jgi:hypothetical protein
VRKVGGEEYGRNTHIRRTEAKKRERSDNYHGSAMGDGYAYARARPPRTYRVGLHYLARERDTMEFWTFIHSLEIWGWAVLYQYSGHCTRTYGTGRMRCYWTGSKGYMVRMSISPMVTVVVRMMGHGDYQKADITIKPVNPFAHLMH